MKGYFKWIWKEYTNFITDKEIPVLGKIFIHLILITEIFTLFFWSYLVIKTATDGILIISIVAMIFSIILWVLTTILVISTIELYNLDKEWEEDLKEFERLKKEINERNETIDRLIKELKE